MTKSIRPIRIEGNIAYVPLTQGYEAIIDAADIPLVEGFNWSPIVTRRCVYARRNDRSGPKQRAVYMHRVIMGEPHCLEVDHKDGNGLNNQRENLRKVTHSQNQKNQRISGANSSGLKGVSFFKQTGQWQARIMSCGKSRHLGLFDNPQDAHEAYKRASQLHHGEFGRTA